MREELKEIAMIERYLQGEMSAEEKSQMEKWMAENPEFRKKVEMQRLMMKGIRRLALRKSVKKAKKHFRRGRNLKWGGSGFLSVALIVGALFVWNMDAEHRQFNKGLYDDLQEQGLYTDDEHLPFELFDIDASQDTVLQTSSGIVAVIEAGSFVDQNGQVYEGPVKVGIKEALNGKDVVKAGLSTMTSDGALLESGGMFQLEAQGENGPLQVNANKGIYMEIPTDEVKEGMALYNGERTKEGIVWKKPKKLETYLTPVDIQSLDFYPPEYESKLVEMGLGDRSKQFKDSLFYSFSKFSLMHEGDSDTTEAIGAVHPSQIKAIWQRKFNNTLLSTREFEERLKLIYRTCDASVLEIYVRGLNKNMYELDSLAAARSYGYLKEEFQKFANRRDGKVKLNDRRLAILQRYYERKSKEYQEASVKLKEAYYEKHEQLNREAKQKKDAHVRKEIQRELDNFIDEFTVNLKEVYKQLDYPKPRPSYRVTVTSVGWNNIDKEVFAATTERTSTTIEWNGKTAKIDYHPFEVDVLDLADYDRVYAYLLPHELSSFQRMKKENGVFTEKLNGFLKYRLAVVGYKGEQAYLYGQVIRENDLGKVECKLEKVSEKELEKTLAGLTLKKKKLELMEDLKHQTFLINDNRRLKNHQQQEQQRARLLPVIYPCYYIGEALPENGKI